MNDRDRSRWLVLSRTACWVALAGSASAQAERHRVAGTTSHGRWGTALANAGDVDGDGAEDWLSGEPGANTSNGVGAGRVELRSGATGVRLREDLGAVQFDGFGAAVALVDDLDGDGLADYAVGIPDHYVGKLHAAGRVEFRSVASGALLAASDGVRSGERFGSNLTALEDMDGDGLGDLLVWSANDAVVVTATGVRHLSLDSKGEAIFAVARLADVDGDGVRDIAVGCPLYSGPLAREGRVYYFSGSTGAELARFDGGAKDLIGWQLASTDDLDGDGLGDLLVGGRISSGSGGPTNGRIEIRSAATFAVLRSQNGQANEFLGQTLVAGGDWDGDGVSEYFAESPVLTLYGSVRMYSGATGAELHVFEGEAIGSQHDHQFGTAMATGDYDGDGVGDVLIGADRWHDNGFGYEGMVHLFGGCPAVEAGYGSGFAGTLLTPTLAISEAPALGATVTLTADNSLGTSTIGILVFGRAPATTPLGSGATLLVDPVAANAIVLPATGWSYVDVVPADPAFCGSEYFLQVLELDPGAVGGISTTQGLALTLGFDL